MSPRPSSAARVTDEPDDFEWPPTADELSVYDVGPDPWHSVRVAASDAFHARRRESPPRAAAAPRVPGITSRPPATRVSGLFVVAIAGAVAVAALAVWNAFRAVPRPVPVETVHHPAPPTDTTAPPRLKVVLTYPVDPPASTPAPTGDAGAAPTAVAPSVVDAPGIPVTPAAAHHALAGVASIGAPDAPIAGNAAGAAAAGATAEDGIRRLLQRYQDGQDVHFDRCDIAVAAAHGSAVCVGTVRYRPAVGSGAERTDRITWTFDLARSGEDWQIDRLTAR